LLNQHRTII